VRPSRNEGRLRPDGLFNPGKIVRPERMDDAAVPLQAEYQPQSFETVLDWSAWAALPAPSRCATTTAPAARPSRASCAVYRATRDEQHVTRGRANTLRLAISGQLGRDALVSAAMRETMALCVSCKGCKRECPTGVDMARMKIEFMHNTASGMRRACASA